MNLISNDWKDLSNVDGESENNDSDKSDVLSFDSKISSYLIKDTTITQEWNEIVNNTKNQYKLYTKRDYIDENFEYETMIDEDFICDEETIIDEDFICEEETINIIKIDALDAAKQNLSEVKLLWTDSLCQHRLNEYITVNTNPYYNYLYFIYNIL